MGTITVAQHVVAFLAIISALAIGELVICFHRVMTARGDVVFYWPVFVLAAFVMAVILQSYWMDFSLYNNDKPYSIAAFTPDLIMRIMLYLTAAAVFPNEYDRVSINLKEHYWQTARYFWSIILVTYCAIWIVYAPRTNLAANPAEFVGQWWGNIVGTLIAITLIATRREWVHKLLILVLFAIVAENFYAQTIS